MLNVEKKSYNQNYNLKNKKLIGADLEDLYFLHNFIILNKRIKILEFGSGWSTFVICNALLNNKIKLNKQSNSIRQTEKFSCCVIETSKKYLDITKRRIKNTNKNKQIKIHYNLTGVNLITYNGVYSTKYKKFPIYNPDLIFLDGPSPFDTSNKINNFTNSHEDFMPLSSDLLFIEYFLQPGTVIIADGRTANVEFLINNFQRNWLHKYYRQ